MLTSGTRVVSVPDGRLCTPTGVPELTTGDPDVPVVGVTAWGSIGAPEFTSVPIVPKVKPPSGASELIAGEADDADVPVGGVPP